MSLRVAIIGNGGREHALCWKLEQSPQVARIYVIPGNGGTEKVGRIENVIMGLTNFQIIVNWCKEESIDLVVVGPEVPLSQGLANTLIDNGIQCFGPTAEAARIESDKEWSKHFMDKYDIPTAKWQSFTNPDDAKNFIRSAPFRATVVKVSGLAAGKGVTVASNADEACEAVNEIFTWNKFGEAGKIVVVEEHLEGEEVSVLAFSDGKIVKTMLPVQDHKRLSNLDEGPNTGGMGAFCPFILNDKQMSFIRDEILQKTIDGMSTENCPFVGVLYAGLMLTPHGIKVLEFNCRFGDPEAEVIMPLLQSDLVEIMQSCCNGTLDHCDVTWKSNLSCVSVVMASEGYPERVALGRVIKGLNEIQRNNPNVHVFHAGTKLQGSDLVTSGGRVLNVVTVDDNLERASVKAVSACSAISFDGHQFRTDIAHKGISRQILTSGCGKYELAGVDISSGNDLIKKIKPSVESTFTSHVLSPLGSFAAVFDIQMYKKYTRPLLVSGCDGVGTKLKIAQACNDHRSIGQDLVAMCVNDILAHGAKPLFFLDYFACGKLQSHLAEEVIVGISEGCKLADCSLVGGETAEMPGLYSEGDYDLAGFVVGITDEVKLLPSNNIQPGDKIIYLPSNGIHSNGFSMVRKIMNDLKFSYCNKAPFSNENKTFGQEFLKPTRIYVNDVLPLIESFKIKAFAHITGGGILENTIRVIPSNLKINIDASKWKIPAVFAWLAAAGRIDEKEMLRTFNCGIGGIVVVAPQYEKEICFQLGSNAIGEIESRTSSESQIEVRNFSSKLGPMMLPYLPNLLKISIIEKTKRVAVLISGTGTNLQALIEHTQNENSEARIVLVISSKNNVKGLDIARKYGVATKVLERNKKESADANDQLIHAELERNNIELVCLAGYMHILSEKLVELWRGKMLNIHPSLLPSFKGMYAQRQALEAGVKITGCTVHFVEPEVDSGAIIEQAVVPIHPTDTEYDLIERIKHQEHIIYPKALKLVAANKVVLNTETGKIIWNLN